MNWTQSGSLSSQARRWRGRCCTDGLKSSTPNGKERNVMNTWNGARLSSPSLDPVIVIGAENPIQRALAREVEALPAPVLRAESMAEAGSIRPPADRAPAIVLIPEDQIDPTEFESDFAELRIRTGSPDLVPIAFGRAPDDERRQEIRAAGIDLALFGRFGRNALRFQINRALSPFASRAPRGELRAPKEWRTRTYADGKEKTVRCYSLSAGGAYFVTPRPWVVGTDISLELPVGHDRLLIAGHILYTNIGDTPSKRRLPSGMAVAFRPLSEHIQQAIRQDLTSTHEALEV